MHPAQLFQRIIDLAPDLTFNDVWPDIDQDWVDTVSAIDHARAGEDTGQVTPGRELSAPRHGLSDNAVHVLDKLHRQKKYGKVSVTLDGLMNLTHVAKRDLEEVVSELRRRGFLAHDGSGRGTISLNSAKWNEIKTIVQEAQ